MTLRWPTSRWQEEAMSGTSSRENQWELCQGPLPTGLEVLCQGQRMLAEPRALHLHEKHLGSEGAHHHRQGGWGPRPSSQPQRPSIRISQPFVTSINYILGFDCGVEGHRRPQTMIRIVRAAGERRRTDCDIVECLHTAEGPKEDGHL